MPAQISDADLLEDLRRLATNGLAPSRSKCRISGNHSPKTYQLRFGGWWQACVRAGLNPRRRRPLTQSQSQEFFDETQGNHTPRHRLIGLSFLLTGLTPTLLNEAGLSSERIINRRDATIATVPAGATHTAEPWQFRLPDTFREQPTGFSGLLNWYLERHGSFGPNPGTSAEVIYRFARAAGLNRRHVDRGKLGTVPEVRAGDLRITGGVEMARNGAPRRTINRHLGLEATNAELSVDDIFTWCEVHADGFSHPDWDPSGLFLDPV